LLKKLVSKCLGESDGNAFRSLLILRHLRWAVRLFSTVDRRADAVKKKRDARIIKIEVLRMLPFGMDVNLAKFERLAFDGPTIKQCDLAARGFELLKESKSQNTESEASEAS
jgi:hypothetical protein